MPHKIFVISGPTASGKSGLALKLARHKEICIINADSLQIYQGLPILSAQPCLQEMQQVEHVLYSHLQPQEHCSVGLWLDLAAAHIKRCFAQNKLPVIVGGTGMYISKLIEGISKIPDIDANIKKEARELFETIGVKAFQEELVALGEDQTRIQPLDKQRLIRAFEVLKQTKKTLTWWHGQEKHKIFDEDNFVHINLNPDRQQLYNNCTMRFEKMLENGALTEVNHLLTQVSDNDPITKTLGFDEIKKLISQEINKEQAIELASQKTRNYAKRQLTWFRHQLPNKFVCENLDQAFDCLTSQVKYDC